MLESASLRLISIDEMKTISKHRQMGSVTSTSASTSKHLFFYLLCVNSLSSEGLWAAPRLCFIFFLWYLHVVTLQRCLYKDLDSEVSHILRK